MFEVFFAYVVATVLLLSFRTTRLWGTVALFILLCVAPVLSGVLLILVAVGCYFAFGKPKWPVIRRRPPWGD
jgi:hypothetical protein